MSFRENIMRKISVDALVKKVIASIGPPGSEKKLDKGAMQELLSLSGYTFNRVRDLDLFVRSGGHEPDSILVLDKELALYRTTPEDVALRKSPTVKEMISIRNAVKILRDSDVVVSRREATVAAIRESCMQNLDLSYDEGDIEAIKQDGIASLENAYSEGVKETLALFVELMGFTQLPASLSVPHCYMAGKNEKQPSGESVYGPIVIYNLMHNMLKMMDTQVGLNDKGKIEHLHKTAKGESQAPFEESAVFEALAERFLSSGGLPGSIYKRVRKT